MIRIVNIKGAIDYIEQKTGRKVIDSTFENNKLTAYLSGEIKSINIKATLDFGREPTPYSLEEYDKYCFECECNGEIPLDFNHP